MAKSKIPQGIEREHVLQAMQEDSQGVPHAFGESTKYDVAHEGKRYPPKALVGLAAKRATGQLLGPSDFSGGEDSACFDLLRQLGFTIELKPEAEDEGDAGFDRADPEAARRVLETLFGKWPDLREAWLTLMGECLLRCADNPTSWSLTVSRYRCRLNAGRAIVFGVSDSGVWLSYDVTGLVGDDASWLQEHAKREKAFDHYPQLGIVCVPGENGAEAIQRFRDRVLRAVFVTMTKRMRRPPMWRTHSEGGLLYLESVLNRKLPRPDLETGGMGRSYWKLAPEIGGRLWEDWRRDGYASIGWPELGDVGRFADREAFDKAREALEFSKGAGQVWSFRHISPGDVIVANRGTSEILGVGDVVAGYYFDPRAGEHPHRIGVKWRDLPPIPVSQPGWRRSLIQLGKREFERLVKDGMAGRDSLADKAVTADEKGSGRFEEVLTRLEDQGLQFQDEMVADFLLALQTKRFVILSGVSGTGKSRLAIETARAFQASVTRKVAPAEPEGAVALEVLPYMRKFHRFVVPVSILADLDLPPRADGSIDVMVEIPKDRDTQRLYRAKDRDVTILLMKRGVWRWFADNLQEGDVFFLQADTDSNQLVLRLSVPAATVESTKLDNLEVIAVRPDWTDHRGLLGYFNPISEQYVTTPFLELLLRADADCRRADTELRAPYPFFVLLDEMNLARVEHYFADFLSALESGQPLHLHDSVTAAEGETSSGTPVPRRLQVPRNVFFIGTVNVDESTYMFSAKVLDRAFTLELNQVTLVPGQDTTAESPLRLYGLPASLVPVRGPEPEDWAVLQQEHEGLAQIVQHMHTILSKEHRHFGYRVANEIARFVLLAVEQAGADAAESALDLALLHKVLPKLHGSQHDLEPLLDQLFAFAVLGDTPSDQDVLRLRQDSGLVVRGVRLVRRSGEVDDDEQPRLPRVAGKLFRMQRRLLRQGFTSFIE